jgi:hypothetical protein
MVLWRRDNLSYNSNGGVTASGRGGRGMAIGIHFGIIVFIGGVLAASGFIISKKPNAKELIDKITPYQGWIGIVLFFWGIWMTISFVTNLGWFLTPSNIIWLATWLAMTVANLGVGFLLGFGLLTKWFLSKNEAAMARGQQIRQKLVSVQIPLGLLAMGCGAWAAIATILF